MKGTRLSRLGALTALIFAACAGPLAAPAENVRPATQGAVAEARQIRPITPTETAVRAVLLPSPAPASTAPISTPLAPTVSPIAPALPTLTLPPRPPLDPASQAAFNALQATAAAQATSVAATAQALPAQEITMKDLSFAPATLTVKPGTTIVWRNVDRVQHQVQGGEFDSGRIHSAGYWASVIGIPGLYQFTCSFHPTMRAEVTVSPDDTRPVHLGT
ncbi:MAG: cupredoxin domain-containing protein [Chloroflexota bacterium]